MVNEQQDLLCVPGFIEQNFSHFDNKKCPIVHFLFMNFTNNDKFEYKIICFGKSPGCMYNIFKMRVNCVYTDI